MRKSIILLSAFLGACGFAASAHAQCVPVMGSDGRPETLCRDFRPLRIAPAVLGDPALIWSASRAALVPVPEDGRARLVGPSIPIDVLIGRRVVGIGRPPEPVVYNNPASLPGSVDPGLVLMRLPAPRRVIVRESSVRLAEVRLRRARILRVKD